MALEPGAGRVPDGDPFGLAVETFKLLGGVLAAVKGLA